MQRETPEPAQVFWSVMLPISWTACWVLARLSSVMAGRGVPIADKALQSVVFLALTLGVVGVIALRQIICHGIDKGRWPLVAMLTTVVIALSVIITKYGIEQA